jgi:hypothetical protein
MLVDVLRSFGVRSAGQVFNTHCKKYETNKKFVFQNLKGDRFENQDVDDWIIRTWLYIKEVHFRYLQMY